MRNLTHKLFHALNLALILSLLLVGLALADNIVNDISAGGNDTFYANSSTTVHYWIVANNGDGENGCNATTTSPATVTINVPSGLTANPSSLTFYSCGTSNSQSVVFSSSTPGDYSTYVTVEDSGIGSYNTNPSNKTIHVLSPADSTPPVITPNVAGTPGNNGWYVSDVTVSWDVSDPESAVSSSSGCEPTTIDYDTAGVTLTCSATSAGGSASQSVTIKRDATPPTVDLVGGPADGASYYFGFVPDAPTCDASDAMSGLAGDCSVSGYAATVGKQTVTASATDQAGNSASVSASYEVLAWTLNGFYQPVDMNGVWNTVKGGSTVPFKFEVFAGTMELTDTAVVSSFVTAKVACPTSGVTVDAIEFTTTGGTSLRYDPVAGQFVNNWQTPKNPGACYVVTMTTQDGSSLVANFKLK